MSQETTAAAELRAIINKWKDVEGSLVMMLHSVQDKLGYVPRETAMVISKETGIPLAKIYEVLTFYHFFKLNPPAKCQIAVCTGTACYLKGAPELLKEIEKCTGVKEGESSPDGKYSVAGLRCIGCCGLAPVITFNDEVSGRVVVDDIAKFIKDEEAKKE